MATRKSGNVYVTMPEGLGGGTPLVEASYSALVTLLNAAASGAYEVGQSFFIRTTGVPDLWISSNNEASSVAYTYTTDAALVSAVNAGSGALQIGYHKVSFIEGSAASADSAKIFVATYGTTTYAQLLAAYNAEKILYLKVASSRGNTLIPLCEFTDGKVVFQNFNPGSNANTAAYYTLNIDDGTWDSSSVTFLVPTEILGYDASKTQVLKNVSGVLSWVDEA